MNKNLEVIQKISQVAKIVCRVLFVCSVVGASLSLVAAITTALFGTGELFELGKISFYGFVTETSGETLPETPQIVMLLIAVTIMLIPAAILTKLAENYFAFELKEGTPFTAEGAERIKKLGIITIALPLAAEIIVQIMANAATETTNADITSGGSIITGLLLIFLHYVFKYGAEISAANNAVPAAPAQTKDKTE